MTQQEFLEKKIIENCKKHKATKEEEKRSLLDLEKIEELLSFILERISIRKVDCSNGNIFPNWSELQGDEIEFEKNGDFYERRYATYEICLDYCIDAISIYVKNHLIHCDELSKILLHLYFILRKRYTFNLLGFKYINGINAWRYNFWGYITGNYYYSLILGSITSGFILFPILAFVFYYVKNFEWMSLLFFALFSYKVLKLFISFILSKFNFKSEKTKKILNLIDCLYYLSSNEIIQPSKLKELCSRVENIPAPISILISQIQNDEDILNGYYDFMLLYKREKEEE